METFVMPTRERSVAIEDRRQRRPEGATVRRDGGAARREEFADTVRTHDRALRALAFRLLGDRDQMDDALQEAYLRAYKALPSFRDEAATATWLYRITYNVCLDRLRERRRTLERLGRLDSLESMAEHGAEPPSPHDPAASAQRNTDLGAALAGLPADQRAAVMLVDAMGYDYSTAANILGVKEGTVASRLHAARALLRGALAARDQPPGRPEEGER